MKKHIIFSGLLMSLLLMSSCNGTYDDWASPQHNDPEDAITIPGFTATAANAIDLGKAGDSVKVFSLSSAALPAGVTRQKTRMIITPKGDTKDATITKINTTDDGKIDSASLQNIIAMNYGKRPVARTYSAHVYSNAINGNGQAILIDAGAVDIVATPAAPFIANAYYLVGDMAGWDATGMVKLSHSSKDVYADPVFSIEFKTTAAGQNLKLITQNNIDNNTFWNGGVQGVVGAKNNHDTSTSGSLATTSDATSSPTAASPGAIQIPDAGTYLLTINMMTYTYKIEKTNKYYLVGGLQGWTSDPATGMTCMFYPTGNGVYSYTANWESGKNTLKIWDQDSFGNWGSAIGSAVDGATDMSGSLVSSSAGAIGAPTSEYYTLTINMSSKTYEWQKSANQSPTAYAKVSIIGAFSGWSDQELTQVTKHNWHGTLTQTTAGELKFRANDDWTDNWGIKQNIGDKYYGTATAGGDNMTVPVGTYNVYFNDITGQFAFVAK